MAINKFRNSSRLLGTILLAVVAAVLFQTTASRADVEWLSKVKSCEEIRQQVKPFVAQLQDKALSVEERQWQWRQMLDVACGERFADCGFKICTKFDPKSTIGLVRPQKTKQQAGEVQADFLTEKQFDEPVILDNLAPQPEERPLAVGIVDDPLAWLNAKLECQDLVDELQVRYGFLGSFDELPKEKYAEFEVVIYNICKKRFVECKLDVCKRLESAEEKAAKKKRIKFPRAIN